MIGAFEPDQAAGGKRAHQGDGDIEKIL